MRNLESTILFIILIATMMVPVSAHGVEITPQSMIIIADNSSGVLAKKVVDEMGLNITVYNFKSESDVSHELEHALGNPNKKILAVAYQNTVNTFLSQHPELSNRVIVCTADETAIKSALNQLNSQKSSTNGDFLTPLLSGLLIGLVFGLGVGAVWMKRKLT